MNYVFVDLDQTLVDTKDLIKSAGAEPVPGTVEHEAWVKAVTDPDTLWNARIVHTVANTVHALSSRLATQVIFITSRRESMRDLTQDWLFKNTFFQTLVMRQETDLRKAGEFKGSYIESIVLPRDFVTVIDDDPDGSVESVCSTHGWTHLKPTTY